MPASARKSFCSTAFTLVELLVVVGVITLLVSILLPMLLKARRSVNGITCESNLRQWGIATTLYANENHGFLPRRGQGVGPTGIIDRPSDWFNALPQILRMPQYQDMVAAGTLPRPPGNSPWICPQASDMPGTYYWSYSMNMALSVWEADEFNGQPNTITGVGNTSIMVLFGDGPGNYCSIYPSITAGGYNPVPRHNNNTVNICFLDGHVSAIPGSYLGCGTGLPAHPDIVWLPPGSTWNSAR
jgi:prepilin-type processing-associated H-X9-DG protein